MSVGGLNGAEPDRRVKIWARVRPGGGPTTSLARERGYAGHSDVHQTVVRMEAAAKRDTKLQRRLERM